MVELLEESQWAVGLRVPSSVRRSILKEVEERELTQSRVISCILMGVVENEDLLKSLLDRKDYPSLRKSREMRAMKKDLSLLEEAPEKAAETPQGQPWGKLPKRPSKSHPERVEAWQASCRRLRLDRLLHALTHPGDFLMSAVIELEISWRQFLTKKQIAEQMPQVLEAKQRRAEIQAQWRDQRLLLCSQLGVLQKQLSTATGRRERMLRRSYVPLLNKLRDFDQQIRLHERPMLRLCFNQAARDVGFEPVVAGEEQAARQTAS